MAALGKSKFETVRFYITLTIHLEKLRKSLMKYQCWQNFSKKFRKVTFQSFVSKLKLPIPLPQKVYA